MSPKRSTLFGFAFALLLASAVPLLVLSTARPALDVRVKPWQLPTGKLFPGHAMGQVFRYPAEELSRIEVLFVHQGEDILQGLRMNLRADGPAGEVLRTVEIEPPATGNDAHFLAFEFPTIEAAKDRQFHFEVSGTDETKVTNWSLWTSWRGRSAAALPWGNRLVGPAEATVEMKCLRDNLSAVALAVDGLNVPAGACRLEIRQVGTEEVLREGLLHHDSPIAGGYAVFSFEPLERSRWLDLEYRFELQEDARVLSTDRGISTISLHGAAPETEWLLGMTRGAQLVPHRDLIFRASGETSATEQLTLLFERLAWPKLLAAWLLSWIASGLLLTFFLRELRPDQSEPTI